MFGGLCLAGHPLRVNRRKHAVKPGLLWAGLNVTPEDFASWRNPSGRIHTYYPIEMIRAVTLVWLFAGIRADEIRRLRVGCVRWQPDNESSVCFLDVPVNKTGTAFTKPVDGVVGQAINAWERVRPAQAKLCDQKTVRDG